MGLMTEGTWKSSLHPLWMIAALLTAVCVLGLTHIPPQAIPRSLQEVAPDKVEHVGAYGLVTVFFLLSLKRPVRLSLLLIGLATLAVTGALDEITQPLVHRTCDIWDYVSDLTGIVIVCTVFLVGKLCSRHD
jgi:VanZ family protein